MDSETTIRGDQTEGILHACMAAVFGEADYQREDDEFYLGADEAFLFAEDDGTWTAGLLTWDTTDEPPSVEVATEEDFDNAAAACRRAVLLLAESRMEEALEALTEAGEEARTSAPQPDPWDDADEEQPRGNPDCEECGGTGETLDIGGDLWPCLTCHPEEREEERG